MRAVLPLVLLAVLSMPSPAAAWGFEPHRFIMDRAIALLPPELRPLFEKNRTMVVERAIDPDTWRAAGFAEEDKHHFLDLDWEGYGKYPYDGLPRDLQAAIAKFGRDQVEDNGIVPWRAEEVHGKLRRAFQDYARRGAFGQFDILFHAATLVHYTSDAHVPFHAVVNYNGQLTNQNGIHGRFESALFERYRSMLTIAPKPMAPILQPRDFIFDRIIEGTQLVPPILQSDLAAIGDRDVYDDAYFSAFFAANRPVLERRLNEAIAASAAMIAGAWEAAGKPPVPVDPPQTPQRRRR
jgi:hypothetical protein